MKKKYIAAFGCLVGLLSCEKATVEPINPSAISYNKNVQPIIEAHCIECHLMGSESAELFDYDHVAATVVSGQLEGCLNGDTNFVKMPTDHVLDDSSKNIIYLWINQGFQDN